MIVPEKYHPATAKPSRNAGHEPVSTTRCRDGSGIPEGLRSDAQLLAGATGLFGTRHRASWQAPQSSSASRLWVAGIVPGILEEGKGLPSCLRIHKCRCAV